MSGSEDHVCLHSVIVCVCAQSCQTLCDPTDCSPPDSSVHGILLGKNIGVGCHFLLQGIFSTQGWNLSPVFAGEFFIAEPLGKLIQSS